MVLVFMSAVSLPRVDLLKNLSMICYICISSSMSLSDNFNIYQSLEC